MSAGFETVSVSALNKYVKTLLETDEVLSQIWVEGEISSFKCHFASGHMYFKLVDKNASVNCVMFKGNASRLKFAPQDGMKVIVNCAVSLYERDGAYQLYARDMIPKGAGDRLTDLQKLTEKLEKEGLFSQERKRPIPYNPSRIVVVSSSSGAAIHDIESVASRRNPFCEIFLVPVNVQGALAVNAIREAISYINTSLEADICIITRGGGSKDDLWIFNDEQLVRAASSLKMPLISAVGHEIDTTLIDLVADRRAATPSSAAEIALKDLSEELDYIQERLSVCKSHLINQTQSSYSLCDEMKRELDYVISSFISENKRNVKHLEELIEASSPLKNLESGFGYITSKGEKVTSTSCVTPGDNLHIRIKDGYIDSTVTGVNRI